MRPHRSRPTHPRHIPAKHLEILFEDDDVLVAVKPTGLPTANAPKETPSLFTLVQGHLSHGAFVGVVSRLDAPVSGVVVFAKTRPAAADLAGQFRDRTVEKSYLAVCSGRFPAPLGQWVDWHDTIERPESVEEGGEASRGQAAHVRARVIRRSGEVSLVELVPSTGRRHQLRAQLASRGCPIVGDRLYGSRLPFPGGIALHASRLSFEHPATGMAVRFESLVESLWKERFPALFATRQT